MKLICCQPIESVVTRWDTDPFSLGRTIIINNQQPTTNNNQQQPTTNNNQQQPTINNQQPNKQQPKHSQNTHITRMPC